MRKKIFLLLIGLIVGIGLFINFELINPAYILITCLILCQVFYLYNKNLIIIPIALGLGFILSLNQFNNFKLKDEQLATLNITILEKRQVDDSYRYVVKANGDGYNEKSIFFDEESYEIGDRMRVLAHVSPPNRNTNPNLFNYRNYLASKKIASELKIESIYKTASSKSVLLSLRARFYNYIHKIFEKNLSRKSAEFVISVVLGENLIGNDEIKDLGLAHILAVSGLHVDLLMGFVLFIFMKLNINYKIAHSLSLITCLFYGYLIGFPFSVIRVLIIEAISFLAFILAQPVDKIKSLMVAAILILLFNPFAILNSGFVLSFVATSGVYLVYPKLAIHTKDNKIFKPLTFTASIQLTLLPSVVYYYGTVNLISILANFLIVPVFTLTLIIVFGIIISYPVLKLLLVPFFKILDYLIYSILNLTSLLSRISLLRMDFAKPHIFIVIYSYVLIVVILHMKKSNKDLLKRFYLTNLIVLSLSIGYDKLNPELSYSMIDIGQGDAFLLADGGDYYLIDVGGPKYNSYDSGERILVPYLKSLGIKEIKAVFISHEDSDHSGNLPALYENFKVGKLITTSLNADGLATYNPTVIAEGDRIKLKNAEISCIFEGEDAEENAQSMGLLIEIDGIKILTLGDLDSEYEDKLDIGADILKVSHHGSRNSTSRVFVEKVNPKAALISAGRNNRYGHPTKEVIENLDGVKIYNTQDRGMVKVVFGKEVKIKSYLRGGYFR